MQGIACRQIFAGAASEAHEVAVATLDDARKVRKRRNELPKLGPLASVRQG